MTDEIQQTKYSGEVKTVKSPIRQVRRAGQLLSQLLREYKCKPYPVHQVVVISHPDASISFQNDSSIPLLLTENLPKYLMQLPDRNNAKISLSDYEKIVEALRNNTIEYKD